MPIMVVCILTRKNSMTVIMLSSAPTTSNHALVVLLSLLLPSASTIATITTNMRSTFRTHCAIIVRSLVVHKHAGVVFYGFDGGGFPDGRGCTLGEFREGSCRIPLGGVARCLGIVGALLGDQSRGSFGGLSCRCGSWSLSLGARGGCLGVLP